MSNKLIFCGSRKTGSFGGSCLPHYVAQTLDSGRAATVEQGWGGRRQKGQAGARIPPAASLWGHQGLRVLIPRATASVRRPSLSLGCHGSPKPFRNPYQHRRACIKPWGSPHPACVCINNSFTKPLFGSHFASMSSFSYWDPDGYTHN